MSPCVRPRLAFPPDDRAAFSPPARSAVLISDGAGPEPPCVACGRVSRVAACVSLRVPCRQMSGWAASARASAPGTTWGMGPGARRRSRLCQRGSLAPIAHARPCPQCPARPAGAVRKLLPLSRPDSDLSATSTRRSSGSGSARTLPLQ